MSIFAIGPLIVSFLTLFFGLFVFLRSQKTRLNIVFFFLCVCVFIWSFSYAQMYNIANDDVRALQWARVGYIGVVFIPVFTYHFICAFLGLQRKRVALLAIYSLAVIFLIISRTDLFLYGGYNFFWGYYPKAGPVYIYFVLFFSYIFIRAVTMLFFALMANKKDLHHAEVNRIKYVLFGFGLATTSIVDYLQNYGVAIYPWGYLSALGWLLCIGWAAFRHRLMDINIALTRASIFVFVYLLVLVLPFVAAQQLQHVLFDIFGRNWWVPILLIGMALATSGPFINQYLRTRAEDLLMRDQRRYQLVLRRLSATLTLIKDIERLLKIIVYRVAKVVKVEFACVYLGSRNQNMFVRKFAYVKRNFVPAMPTELDKESKIIKYIQGKKGPLFIEELNMHVPGSFPLRNGLIIPSFIGERLFGFLVLGPKLSGAMYTEEDAIVFGILANQLALAIENTEFLDDFQKAQAQMFAAEQMASMGTMAGGMTHQINNRFHVIILGASDAVDSLKRIDASALSDEGKDLLKQAIYGAERILANAEHGGKIANDFLNFSQPERMKREAKEFDLKEPLARAIEMVRLKKANSDQRIERILPAEALKMEGNFVLLQDAFFNILDNALDAMDAKEQAIVSHKIPHEGVYQGKITVHMEQKDGHVITTIQDNGIGIDDEMKKKMFVPFFTTKATAHKGTGLGMFVIQKIIHAHHGQIHLESQYGQGTTMKIILPQNSADQPAA